jgi:hypothetical protein
MRPALLLSRREVIVTLAGVATALACGKRTSDQPVTIAYGRDECAWCRMTVDDPALAAEWIAPDAPAVLFGEPGCLLAWLAAHRGTSGTAWVQARDSEEWLRASEVTFAHGIATTPMSFNLTAHRQAPSATPGVTLFSWPQLLEKGPPDARPS